MFQFLIGRLESAVLVAESELSPEFQFLIGRLESPRHDGTNSHRLKFQFLIGRLESRQAHDGRHRISGFNSL